MNGSQRLTGSNAELVSRPVPHSPWLAPQLWAVMAAPAPVMPVAICARRPMALAGQWWCPPEAPRTIRRTVLQCPAQLLDAHSDGLTSRQSVLPLSSWSRHCRNPPTTLANTEDGETVRLSNQQVLLTNRPANEPVFQFGAFHGDIAKADEAKSAMHLRIGVQLVN